MIHTEATGEDSYAGIIMFIAKTFKITRSTELIKGRMLNTKLKHTTTNKDYNITSFYGYSGKDSPQNKISAVIEKLETTHDQGGENMILGDFNFVDNDLDRTNESKIGMNQNDKKISGPWIKFTIKQNR